MGLKEVTCFYVRINLAVPLASEVETGVPERLYDIAGHLVSDKSGS